MAFTPSTGWHARLTLGFQRQGPRTILARRAHQGPLQVQRPFYPEGETVCHVALLHPPGGVVGGDELRIDVALDPGAQALLTTPAAGKFYRSAGPLAHQTQHLTVAPGAALEWLPQENIVYAGAGVHALTRIQLQGDARFLGWEIFCLGRPAAGETFATGEYRQHFELWRDGEPLYLEHGRYAGGDAVLDARWGLQGQPASATLVCTPPAPEAIDAIRAEWERLAAPSPSTVLPSLGKEEWFDPARNLSPGPGGAELFAVSQLDGVLFCRYLGPSAARARGFFTLAWGLLRPAILERPPCPSRFWNT